jgi:PhnB protein
LREVPIPPIGEPTVGDAAGPTVTITPYLCVHAANAAIDFYREAFDATETLRFGEPGGRVGHAEPMIGDAVVMLADEFPDLGVVSPQALGGSPVTLTITVPDVDASVARALAAGATLSRPVTDKFYGDRTGLVIDPLGHRWTISTHVEDASTEEMMRAAEPADEK